MAPRWGRRVAVTPNLAAISGSCEAVFFTIWRSSSSGSSGTDSRTKLGRTTERLTASRIVARRCCVTLPLTASFAASVSRWRRSPGRRAPAFGGRELSRRARTTRPSTSVVEISVTHSVCAASTRVFKPSRSWVASALVSSSFAASAAATTTLRRSLRSISLMSASAASARSRHSARRSFGRRLSARARRGSPSMAGLPSALAFSFWVSISLRTDCMPPRLSVSAMIFCSSGKVSIHAVRCARPGRSFFGFGRSS